MRPVGSGACTIYLCKERNGLRSWKGAKLPESEALSQAPNLPAL